MQDNFDVNKVTTTWNYEEEMAKIEADLAKKNFRNWFDKHFDFCHFPYRPSYLITHPWVWIDNAWDEVRYAWQRVFRGWDDTVCWSIDGYLADMIPQWMRRMQKVAHGWTMDLYTDEEIEIISNGGQVSEEREKALFQEWKNILEEIAVGFEAYRETDENEYTSIWYKGQEERLAKFEKGFDLFRKYFRNLWD
jgi:hypothetical protein